MKKNLCIISLDYLNSETGELMIGGVQTYIHSLCTLANEKGFNVTVFQIKGKQEHDYVYAGTKVIIRNIPDNNIQKYFDSIYKQFSPSETIFIISTDQLPIKSNAKNVVTIQHGIAFDIPGYSIEGAWGKSKLSQHINKLLRCIKNVMRCYNSRNTICVDYNYYNWFRTLGTIYPEKSIRVIPNYSTSYISTEELDQKLIERSNKKKILFARRFCDYRGTLIFSKVILRILSKYPNVEVTFAGNGPLEDYIRETFQKYDSVKITKFCATDSISFHKQYDIAVVPTIYSEGTSLSLLEAMSSGCLPLATHVGGMTNIILDQYNGVLCSPDEESLYKSLVDIIEMDDNVFNDIVRNAYDSAVKAFSYKIWKQRWSCYIDELMQEL